MKLIATAIALALALAGGSFRPAKAQGYPVIDVVSISKLLIEIQVLNQQYQQLQATYEVLAHPSTVAGMMPGLSVAGVRNPLGTVTQVPGIMYGSSFGNVTGLAQGFLDTNRYYAPPGQDYQAQEINRQAQATAGVQALAMQNLQATQARMAQLPLLQAQLDSAGNVEDVNAINNRIQVEHQFVQTQQDQVHQLELFQQAQNQVNAERREQKQRQDADTMFNDTQALD